MIYIRCHGAHCVCNAFHCYWSKAPNTQSTERKTQKKQQAQRRKTIQIWPISRVHTHKKKCAVTSSAHLYWPIHLVISTTRFIFCVCVCTATTENSRACINVCLLEMLKRHVCSLARERARALYLCFDLNCCCCSHTDTQTHSKTPTDNVAYSLGYTVLQSFLYTTARSAPAHRHNIARTHRLWYSTHLIMWFA